MNDAKHQQLLSRLNSLEHEVTLLKIVHEKILEEIRLQNALLSDLKEDQKSDEWWKNGDEPPC